MLLSQSRQEISACLWLKMLLMLLQTWKSLVAFLRSATRAGSLATRWWPFTPDSSGESSSILRLLAFTMPPTMWPRSLASGRYSTNRLSSTSDAKSTLSSSRCLASYSATHMICTSSKTPFIRSQSLTSGLFACSAFEGGELTLSVSLLAHTFSCLTIQSRNSSLLMNCAKTCRYTLTFLMKTPKLQASAAGRQFHFWMLSPICQRYSWSLSLWLCLVPMIRMSFLNSAAICSSLSVRISLAGLIFRPLKPNLNPSIVGSLLLSSYTCTEELVSLSQLTSSSITAGQAVSSSSSSFLRGSSSIFCPTTSLCPITPHREASLDSGSSCRSSQLMQVLSPSSSSSIEFILLALFTTFSFFFMALVGEGVSSLGPCWLHELNTCDQPGLSYLTSTSMGVGDWVSMSSWTRPTRFTDESVSRGGRTELSPSAVQGGIMLQLLTLYDDTPHDT